MTLPNSKKKNIRSRMKRSIEKSEGYRDYLHDKQVWSIRKICGAEAIHQGSYSKKHVA